MGAPLGKPFSILDNLIIYRYTGLFDFEGLYRMMHAWFINKRFIFQETLYKDKVFSPFGNELEVKWAAERKVTEFVKEHITVYFHLWDFSEVDVIKDGKKMKMTKSRMEIQFDAKLEFDYTGRFSKGGKLAQALGDFYLNKIMYWEWRFKYANSLTYSLYDLHARVKKYLNTESGSNAY